MSATCTINNNDQPRHLTLVKTVTNDNGGTAVPTDWTLTATGPTPISGATGSTAVTNAPVSAGTYDPSESGGPAGYTAGAWSCTAGETRSPDQPDPAGLGENATCTINNNDQPATLTLVKTVTNDNGGTACRPPGPSRRPARRRSPARPGRARSPTPRSTPAPTRSRESGGPAGYTAGAWSCTAGTLTGAIARPAERRERDLHDQQRRPARHADPGQDRHQRQRRHGRADRLDADRRPDRRTITGTTGSAAVTDAVGQRRHLHPERVGRPAGYTAGVVL